MTAYNTLDRMRVRYDDEGNACGRNCCYYAYCLMGNHFHLLIRERDERVGETIKRIASSYVYYYNRKYGRDGHLFKERFKSEPVNDMEYFTVLLRYIHQNPVKAGIVEKVKDYEFSSWGEYDGTVELNEQREQNQMNLSYAKSRGKSTKSTSVSDLRCQYRTDPNHL